MENAARPAAASGLKRVLAHLAAASRSIGLFLTNAQPGSTCGRVARRGLWGLCSDARGRRKKLTTRNLLPALELDAGRASSLEAIPATGNVRWAS
eukprot:13444786-Alexandrium_andersonii.AAC.2